MLKTATQPRTRKLQDVRQELAAIHEVADSAVQHEMNRIELAFPDILEHEKQRLIALAVRPHREREERELHALVDELSAADRRRLFDETLDARLLPR